MKCLLCSEKFDENNDEKLLEHYIKFHKIDKRNWFFKNLFSNKPNVKILKKCIRCDEFIYDSKAKSEHDFLNHFQAGRQHPFETKPLEIKKLKDKIIIYSISFSLHNNSYNFFDSEECVEDFLNNCRDKFENSEDQKSFKCSFTIKINKILRLRVERLCLIIDIGQQQYMMVFILMTLYFLILKVKYLTG